MAGKKPRMTSRAAACGCAAQQENRKALAVDPEIKSSNLKRLRRIEGQIRGLQRLVSEDRYCADILVQISSVQEALRSVGRELMRNHLRHCASVGELGADPGFREKTECQRRSHDINNPTESGLGNHFFPDWFQHHHQRNRISAPAAPDLSSVPSRRYVHCDGRRVC